MARKSGARMYCRYRLPQPTRHQISGLLEEPATTMTLPMGYPRKGVIALVIGLLVVTVFVLALLPSSHNAKGVSATLTILGRTNENGRQVVDFELRVPRGRRISIRRADLVTDWGISAASHGPPEWTPGADPAGKVFGPGSKIHLRIVEPSQHLRRLRLETIDFEVGPQAWSRKIKLLWQTKKLSVLKMDLPSEHQFDYLQSGVISFYTSEPKH